MVLNPERFDVIVASNLFGDHLSDLAGDRRHHRHCRLREHQSRAHRAFHLRAVHGSAPRHRRQEDRNPSHDLVRRR